ncbi:hypothetical protein F4561_006422 [Lipingzhangella halophila]|uniref:Uncharacterized protein n=1 Tax=Lipingzhangella halophila TaxID=1783352 RepID=A0A7W7RQ07_9ACTN|nr:hypothetical protein [Lipingzhangella halophila]MBB4935528.1 hypothetical protein [Lipingzhangella halophila]
MTMATTSQPRAIWSMLDGYRPITNLLGAGDPNVHKIDNQWWMFFGGFQRNFTNNLFSASLPKGASLGENPRWTIRTDPARPHTALPLVDQPAKGEWDHYGLHEPCFVSGFTTTPAGERVPCRRIYYTGRSSRTTLGNDTPFAIGVLEQTPDGWRRHPDPVVVGDSENPSALGPKVIFADGKWRMWFRAAPGEPAKGDTPVAEIHYTESEDGIGGWTPPRPFYSRADLFAHAYVLKTASRYEMLLSKSPNLFGEPHYPQQGLWLATSDTPSGDVADWSTPEMLLRAADGPAWVRNGYLGSSLCVDDASESAGTRHVFCTGVHESISWPKYALTRLASLRRPPVPSPFYFTIGHVALDLGT